MQHAANQSDCLVGLHQQKELFTLSIFLMPLLQEAKVHWCEQCAYLVTVQP